MGGRVVLLVTSPRLPAGLLTAQAWDLVRAHPVYASATPAESGQVAALRAAGVEVHPLRPVAADLLAEVAEHGTVVWLSGPAGDENLVRELGLALVREPGVAELELAYGSWDPSGSRLLDAVAVIDRLAAPGGDPWLRQYTASADRREAAAGLAHYLLEEAYEAYDAIGAGDPAAVREELGDVLFQVLLHARLGEPDESQAPAGSGEASGTPGFDIDEVAGELVDKLVRRNPHVFGDAEVADVEEITRNWEQIKRTEKARSSCVDGIALSQPALALAAKVLARVDRTADRRVPAALPQPPSQPESQPQAPVASAAELGARLFALVSQAHEAGLDAEAALRRYTLDTIEAVRRAETADGGDDAAANAAG